MSQFESEHLVYLIECRIFQLSDEWIITGYPYVPPTPFSPKDFEKRDLKNDLPIYTTRIPAVSRSGSIEKIDEAVTFSQPRAIEEDMALFSRVRNHQKSIYVMHAPHYDTVLDRLWEGRSIGNKAIRHFINRDQSSITLHGHIHESTVVSGCYWQKIGKILSINSGQMGHHLSAVIWDPSQSMETLTHTLYGGVQSPQSIG